MDDKMRAHTVTAENMDDTIVKVGQYELDCIIGDNGQLVITVTYGNEEFIRDIIVSTNGNIVHG